MKRFLGLLLALSLLLALAACGLSAPAPTETPAPTEEPAPAETPAPTEEPAPAETAGLAFSTTDRGGETWTEEALGDYALVMINFWEPWCPPCVGEMPELQALYEAYRERGFLILGVYSEEGMETEVDKVLADCGTAYPILHYCKAFDQFQTGYVPTTIFVSGEGEVLGAAAIGSKSYEAWERLILGFGLLPEA